MDAILDDLGQLMLRALPTVILFILLHLYLKWMFYRPMQGVLEERREATDGAREAAEESARLTERKAAEYEAALGEVRVELQREQEESRLRLLLHQSEQIADARKQNQELVQSARESIAAEMANVRDSLEAEAEELSNRIVSVLIEGKRS